MTSKDNPYNQRMDIKYRHHEMIDVPGIVAACQHDWFNQTLTKVNASVVRLGVVEGEYHWHKHDEEDEFFFVLSGKLIVELEDESIVLEPNQGVTISRGVLHRPRAPVKTVMLMVESDSIDPLGT